MKTLLFATLLGLSATAQAEWTNGYTRSNGTYVQGYNHTHADGNPYNNYTSQGNVNPYSGAVGTVQPAPTYGNPYMQPYSGSHY